MRYLPWLLVWAATVVGAWFLGHESVVAPGDRERDGTGTPPGPPAGAPGGGAGLDRARPASDRLRPVEVPVVPMSAPLDLEGTTTSEEVLERLFAYTSAHLAGGRDVQLELYRTLDRLLETQPWGPAFDERLDGPRSLYPVARFLLDRDAQVADLVETVFRTAAEEPAFFESTSGSTLKLFTEVLGPLLPGMLSDARLERVRGYVKAALAQPEERQPKTLRAGRGELERLLEAWVPALSSGAAAERLRTGRVTGREALGLLRRVKPAERAALDLGALVGPMLDEGDVAGLTPALLPGVEARTLSALDTRLIEASARSGQMGDWHLRQWLAATGRTGWDAARGFLEQALRQGGRTADAAALSLLSLEPRPPSETVASLLRSYTLDASVVAGVRAGFGLK